MFDNLRDTIQNVQSLSSGLLDLSVGERKIKDPVKGVNLNAGANLLSWNQFHWNKCHERNTVNSQLAESISDHVNYLDKRSNIFKKALDDLIAQCDKLPQLDESIDIVENDLIILKQNILKVEKALDELKMRRELENCIQFKVDQSLRISRYKDTKTMELNALKNQLAADHAKKIANYERLELLKLKERQLVYQAAFEEDLNFYKTHGMVNKRSESKESTKPLEEVEVESNDEDKEALDHFLGSTELS